MRKRESALLLGPAGSGKTKLLRLACESSGGNAVYVPYVPVPHDLLVSLAGKLLPKSATGSTSLRLRGLLWNHLEANPCVILLDGVHRPSHPVYRFFQRLYYAPGMAIIAAARDLDALGTLRRLFWDPRDVIPLQPLPGAEALRLFELAVDRFQLRGLELNGFRRRALESAKGNPGQLIEMCRLATKTEYVSGRHVKFAPLRMDAIIRSSG